MTVDLVYLARGTDGGLPAAEAFFRAHDDSPPGCTHALTVVAKGWSATPGLQELRQLAAAHGAQTVELPDDGYDWGAYMRVAPLLKREWACFLNTHSRPGVAGWLGLLRTSAGDASLSAGAIGASGSWETVLPRLGPRLPLLQPSLAVYPARLAWNALRILANRADFEGFPNPHLRSNAFLMRLDLFREFAANQAVPATKSQALLLESGKRGLSSFLKGKKRSLYVQGADGRAYGESRWIESETFRVPRQRNLLVRDNQTSAYENADLLMKRRLEQLAWGRTFSPMPTRPGADGNA